ncbi:DEAD/DEAH box helicase [Mycolicibacterium sp. CBMA 361]|uniref:DEAD/DEAH box helicase n=1 Tax=Mycolicibacterium sp. CBMA 361 TaxID=2606610 RepID=UPI0012DCDE4A|nr:DEAD/DEAH box helicase [Mycolicibacterium sp. CBMA 361]MUM34854.1 DEAD/DEAH box helicase [Mycolicibacterium sp. CBMA 361]
MTALTSITAPEKTFADLGVRDEIVQALAEDGKAHPFAIQELTLPLALAGDDLIGQARTGMGKTLAFGVPLLHRVATDPALPLTGTPRALVVVPTRELCIQVYGDLTMAGKHLKAGEAGERKLRVEAIYGGRPYEPQIEALKQGVDVIVGTPGRLLDLAQQGHLQLGGLSVLVLDEADEMLDLGFLPDIERILRLTPDSRQAMLFSATMPDPIITLARTFMNQPTHIRAEAPHSAATHDTTKQFVYRAHALDKVEMVSRILQANGRGATMVFTRTKRTAQKVADELAVGHLVFGNLEVDDVRDVVAARGIDIDDITHVINFQIPEDEMSYVHRIGRTGRAGKTGIAVTLVDWDELTRWSLIDKALNLDCPDPAETYSRSPHLYEELDIPTDVTGSVGASRVKPDKKASRSASDPELKRESSTDKDRPTRARSRSRRRTRAGETATGHVETSGATEAGEDESSTGDSPAESAHSGRRRRRRRPNKASSEAAVAAAPAAE